MSTRSFTEEGGWIEAEDLRSGDTVVSLSGVPGEVESLTIVEETRTMYDLTVADMHTFAVGEGQWVVHNQNPRCACGVEFDYQR